MLRTFLFLGFIFAGTSAFAAGDGGIPVKSLATHGFNLFVFLCVLSWALLKKMDLPHLAKEKREAVAKEIEGAKDSLENAEKQKKEFEQKIAAAQNESTEILKNAEARAKSMVTNLKSEAEVLSKKIVEDAQVVAEQEFIRMKEKVATETVEAAIAQASEMIQQKLDTSRDEQAIQKQLDNIGKS